MRSRDTLGTYQHAITYMKENLHRKLCVADIADYCFVSVSGLEKIFAKYSAGGVMQFFLEMKLEQSKKMLQQGYRNHEISKRLSFSSPAHFSGMFKKKFGISPLQYKDKARREMLQSKEVLQHEFSAERVMRMSNDQATCVMLLLEVKKYIEERFADPKLKVSSIAMALEEKSYQDVSYLFQPEIKQAIKAYIGSVRILHSKKLLSETGIAIKEIADLCGFSGDAVFCRLFREATTMSPTEYRYCKKA
ncbi:MAG: helix-turn-helix domain-containing protein [Clostridia bacterium]|nr:helix-turn-helix domain-containing protein [Clostridia bacterium]